MKIALLNGRGAPALIALLTAATLTSAAWVSSEPRNSDAATLAAAETPAAAPDPFIRDVETWVTTSQSNRSYKISVALPAGYSEDADPYRVLYVTDANAHFGIAVETARSEAPNTIVVAIGYDNPGQGYAAAGPRSLDLTPTSIGATTGGAPEFLLFLRDELVPQIERDFNASTDDRTLMGHSFGGLFATYTLLNNDGLFHRFVIASPSLWWDDETILAAEQEYAASNDTLPARVFLSVGSLEEEIPDLSMTSNTIRFANTLSARSYDGFELGAYVFEHETHTGVVGASFSRGLRFVYAQPGTTVPGTVVDELPEVDAVAPQVTSHPSNAEVTAGQDATLASAATGIPEPSVQWQVKLSDSDEWADIPGATHADYTITSAESANGSRYRAVFSNSEGEAITDEAILTVRAAEDPDPSEPSGSDATADPGPGGIGGDADSSAGAGASDELANTGAETGIAVLASLFLLTAGAGVVLAARRRTARAGND